MGTFVYFAIGLTVVYIIYYGILISQIVIHEKKAGADAAETFNVSEMAIGSSGIKTVVETSDGKFNVEEDIQTESSQDSPIKSAEGQEEEKPYPQKNLEPLKAEQEEKKLKPSAEEQKAQAELEKAIEEKTSKLEPVEGRYLNTEISSTELLSMFEDLNNEEVSKRICLVRVAPPANAA